MQKSSSRTPTGISGLDEILGGGFPQGRVILVIGEPGAGKTVLGSQFLINGINTFGESGLLLSLKENKTHYTSDMNQFGWDFDSVEKQGKFSFIDASPIRAIPGEVKIGKLTVGNQNFSLLSLLELMRNNAKTINAKRIVIDSLSMLELQYPDAIQRRKVVFDIVEALTESGTTGLLTSDFTSIGLEPFTALEDFLRFSIIQFEKQLFHGVITMQTLYPGKLVARALTVEKIRGMQIDRQPRPYKITEKGIVVFPREILI
jgi:circadian clock protein KaiC